MLDQCFINEIKKIYHYICPFEVEAIRQEILDLKSINPIQCVRISYEGFKLGQEIILQNSIRLQSDYSNKKQEIKEYKKNRDRLQENIAESELKIIEFKKKIIQNLAFTIVWQLFLGKKERISRLYTHENSENQLFGDGFEALLRAANEINKDPNKFAFITDLTRIIQIGDLIVQSPEGQEIIEFKTGKKNNEAFRLIEFYEVNSIRIDKDILSKFSDCNFTHQVLRIVRQKEKLDRAAKILKDDIGASPESPDMMVVIPDSPYIEETYHEEIIALLENLRHKNWSYTNIEGIVSIGMYKNHFRAFGRQLILSLNNNYPVFNIMDSVSIICEPIFLKGLSEKQIVDIIRGEILIYIGINIDELISLSNKLGLNMRWSTKKEFGAMTNRAKKMSEEIFTHERKSLVMHPLQDPSNLLFVGYGMLTRIIYDHVIPSSIIMNRKLAIEGFPNNT